MSRVFNTQADRAHKTKVKKGKAREVRSSFFESQRSYAPKPN